MGGRVISRSDEVLQFILEKLEGNGGDYKKACEGAGVSVAWLQRWMKDDPRIAKAVLDSRRLGAVVLESVALDRAINGTLTPMVVDGEVQYVTKNNDALLMFLLKNRVKDYKDAPPVVDNSKNLTINNTLIEAFPRAASYDEWLSRHVENQLVSRDPKHIIDVTPERLLPPAGDDGDDIF